MSKGETTKIKLMKQKRNMRTKAGGLLQALIALVFLVLGILAIYFLVKLRKPPQRVEQEVLAPLVKVQQLRKQDIQMIVSGYGTVSAKVQTDIVPEVSGKVVNVNPQLKPGGFIPAKEQVLKIDPRDYELAVQQAQALVADAQVKLDVEIAEAEVAKNEWQGLHPNTEPTSSLVLREPQIKQAQAALASAKAQLATAGLQLERTSVSLPFDALIISEKVDLGQYVVAGQSMGVAYGTEAVEIEVPLEDKELAWFDVFADSIAVDSNEVKNKTKTSIKAEFAGVKQTWNGYIVRTTGQVDRTSRMVSVVVEVPNPFDTSSGKPPLLPGAFVEVFIEGKILKDAIAVPRDALHDGNKVWLVNDGHLQIRPLEILRADKDFAYIRSGIEDKAMIATSSLDTAIEGMKVRTKSENIDVVQESAPETN
jgi:RND family efflux transporter MFP subunit